MFAPFKSLIPMLFALLVMASPSQANPEALPPHFKSVGSGTLSWLGMRVYDATLFADNGSYSPDEAYALRIDYRFRFSADELAASSLKEIEHIYGKQQGSEAFRHHLSQLFCDVERGDHITGLYQPGSGAEFFCNGKPQGRLDDPLLAQAFFAIWLDPGTREPKLRQQLLGLSP